MGREGNDRSRVCKPWWGQNSNPLCWISAIASAAWELPGSFRLSVLFGYMIVDEITELWEQRPFVPFEVTTSDGKTHRVESEKWMLLMPDRTTLHYVTADNRSRYVALHQVTSITSVPAGKSRRPRSR